MHIYIYIYAYTFFDRLQPHCSFKNDSVDRQRACTWTRVHTLDNGTSATFPVLRGRYASMWSYIQYTINFDYPFLTFFTPLFHPDYIHIYVYVYTSLRIVRFEHSRNISRGRVSIRNFPDSMAALRFEGGRGMKINSRGQDSFFKAFTSKPYLTNIERSH